jgi:hypothetical protein
MAYVLLKADATISADKTDETFAAENNFEWLEWNLDGKVKEAIVTAADNINRFC